MGVGGHKHHFNDSHIEKEMKGIGDADPLTKLKELCSEDHGCEKFKSRLQQCTDRVQNKSYTKETCNEELLDFLHCVDECMAMAATRFLIRTATASRNPVFRLMSARTQATSTAPASGSAADMLFTFASPSEVFYSQAKNVRQIDVPTVSGNMGILAHHVPILGVLKPGVVSVFEVDGNTKRFFVSSGSVAVHPDSSVQLLAEEATLIENLDSKAAHDALSEAQRRLGTAKDDKQKAEAQIEIDCAEAAIKAASGVFQ
ncbi:unnamed protein product [Rotaria sp. Silwood1]|nr:unnamed protein product [Rotaria sp. Silwood1]CAF4874851.1 unnamed protein product [Rotaria sp. Silwood1]